MTDSSALVTVWTAAGQVEAEVVRARLEVEGINAMLSPLHSNYSHVEAGGSQVAVLVLEEDRVEAVVTLESIDEFDGEPGELRDDVPHTRQRRQKPIFVKVLALFLLLATVGGMLVAGVGNLLRVLSEF